MRESKDNKRGEREEAWVASCSSFGVSSPGSNPVGRAFMTQRADTLASSPSKNNKGYNI